MNVDMQAARVYGEALFGAVEDRGDDMHAVLDRVRMVRQGFAQTPEFTDYLGAPNVSREKKDELIRGAIGKMGLPLLRNFMLLLLQRGRLDLLGPALREFQLLAEKKLGIARGRVATAKPLSEDEKQRLQQSLQSYTGNNLSITWVVEPELIGGVVFKSGDLLIDSSLLSQLGRLKATLMAPRVY